MDCKKVDIECVFSDKLSSFSTKTIAHIYKMFNKYGYNEVFGRSAVRELLKLKDSSVSKLLSKLLQSDIIENVSGYGKGKYKFKRND